MRGLSLHRAISLALFLVLGVLILFPLWAIIHEAVISDGSVSLDVVREVVAQPGLKEAAVNTLLVTGISGVLATILGVVLAIAATVVPAGRAMRRTLQFVPLVPLTIPALVGALGWVFLLAPRTGWINALIREVTGSDAPTGPIEVFTVPGVIFVTTLYVVPYVFTIMASSLQRVDSQTLEAMLTSGASPVSMLWRTVAGVLRPALLAGMTLAFVQTISLFSVALVLRVNVLTTYVFRSATALGRPDFGAAASIPLIAIALILSGLQFVFMRNAHRYVTMTGKGSTGKTVSLGRPLNGLFKAVGLVYLFLTSVLPIGAIFLVSLLPFWKPNFSWSDLSFKNYNVMGQNLQFQTGMTNSLILGGGCAAGAVVITVLVVLFAERLRDGVARVTLIVANLPLGIPATVLGLGFLIAFINPPVVLYGSMTLLVLVYLVAFLPLSLRNVSPVVQQVGIELEEAAMVSGATWGSAARRITLPLAAPGIAASLMLLFIIIFREFPIASFVSTPGTNVVAISLLSAYDNGQLGQAAVISMAICAISFVGIALYVWLGNSVSLGNGKGRMKLPRRTTAAALAPLSITDEPVLPAS